MTTNRITSLRELLHYRSFPRVLWSNGLGRDQRVSDILGKESNWSFIPAVKSRVSRATSSTGIELPDEEKHGGPPGTREWVTHLFLWATCFPIPWVNANVHSGKGSSKAEKSSSSSSPCSLINLLRETSWHIKNIWLNITQHYLLNIISNNFHWKKKQNMFRQKL